MMLMVIRTLEFNHHCLDASMWPFSMKEILTNYALLIEHKTSWKWMSFPKSSVTNKLFSL